MQKNIVDKLMKWNSYMDVYVIPNSTFNKEKTHIIKNNKQKFNVSRKEILISSFDNVNCYNNFIFY